MLSWQRTGDLRGRAATVASILYLLIPSAAHGQSRARFGLDANFWTATVSYARAVAPRHYLGIGLYAGVPSGTRTLTPEEGRFQEYLGLLAFWRGVSSSHFEYDTGLRASIADLRECTASDCWPGLFVGTYVTLLVGGRRLKIGPGFSAGWMNEPGYPATFAASITPFILRWTIAGG